LVGRLYIKLNTDLRFRMVGQLYIRFCLTVTLVLRLTGSNQLLPVCVWLQQALSQVLEGSRVATVAAIHRRGPSSATRHSGDMIPTAGKPIQQAPSHQVNYLPLLLLLAIFHVPTNLLHGAKSFLRS